jgi:hypothetical protein
MTPMYRPGDVIVANPLAAPQPASGVVLTHRDGRGLLIREYVSETGTMWTLQRYGGHEGAAIENVSKTDYPTAAVVQALVPGR